MTGSGEVAGSIEVGKMADMIVLDRNLFDASPEEVGQIRVLLTIFEGREIYKMQ
ncbi:Amidohydrolase family protein [Novosphingobium mathurense]|uniref:Amidohydrolase family protein n=1 Tax=Novosphingobium mathurense TaxID=428990 RepID=A0A1U6I7R8_9SPHN|nr:hypothetical protein SPHV1_2360007 [Novosphingobium sp. KN65.2]SLK04098.1 Amidohydrolase family protein [Novosphingobium mathurense]